MALFSVLSNLAFSVAYADVYPVAPSDSEVTRIEKTFQTQDGLTLHGHLALPPGSEGKKLPAVLMLVGSGAGNRYEDVPGGFTADGKPTLLFAGFEKAFVKKGYAVFMYDKRGVIPTDSTFSDETVTDVYKNTADAVNLANDASLAFDALKSFSEVDSAQISVFGHSEGTLLALKVAERHTDVKGLYLLGILTRSFSDIGYYQAVTSQMRLFFNIDDDHDEYVSEAEYLPLAADFKAKGESGLPETFSEFVQAFDFNGDGQVSLYELRTVLEWNNIERERTIADNLAKWTRSTPRAWFQQYNAEGSFLSRFSKFCSISHIFQGEFDVQTPVEDAYVLATQCTQNKTPLASLKVYSGLGHGFSSNVGYRGWKNTIGPIDERVIVDVAQSLF